MAIPGRKPKPTETKRASANPGKRKLNRKEPKPAVTVPIPPAGLPEIALPAWEERVGQAMSMGICTEVDHRALAALAVVETMEEACWELLAKSIDEGFVLTTEKGFIKDPLLTAFAGFSKDARLGRSEFGFTPSSRSGLKVPKPKSAEEQEEAAAMEPRMRVVDGGKK